ncbi:hypothetical protein [Bradyrhizobium sp. USDA 336]|uniref:hypothetical protein n=1 Tax=Bradyrhizobium sp. USDA 336 TaxID=3156311 RepID=UPI0038357FCF
MKVFDISYTPNPINDIRQAADDVMRLSRLAAEFGHADPARKVLEDFQAAIARTTFELARPESVGRSG